MITERSGHGKARNVFIKVPHALRTHIPACLVFKGLHSAAMREDTRLFIWLIGLMVTI
jgi:hypothetical protein